jgi:uncharacterized small protein (DUF1192 family)
MIYKNKISTSNFTIGANCFDELPLEAYTTSELKDRLIVLNNTINALKAKTPKNNKDKKTIDAKIQLATNEVAKVNNLLAAGGVTLAPVLPQPSGAAVSMPQTMGGPTIDTEAPVSGGEVVKNPLMDNTMIIYIAILAAAAAYYFYFRKK